MVMMKIEKKKKNVCCRPTSTAILGQEGRRM